MWYQKHKKLLSFVHLCDIFTIFAENKWLLHIYDSDTYLYLSRKMYHLHNMSDAYLVDEILLELLNRQQLRTIERA